MMDGSWDVFNTGLGWNKAARYKKSILSYDSIRVTMRGLLCFDIFPWLGL